jgi:hypothetical protein
MNTITIAAPERDILWEEFRCFATPLEGVQSMIENGEPIDAEERLELGGVLELADALGWSFEESGKECRIPLSAGVVAILQAMHDLEETNIGDNEVNHLTHDVIAITDALLSGASAYAEAAALAFRPKPTT